MAGNTIFIQKFSVKQFLPIIVAILCCGTVNAYDFSVDGIEYNITSTTTLTVEVVGGTTKNGNIVIPSTINKNGTTYNVTSIGDYAFDFRTDIVSVTIPNSVTNIGNDAFMGCSKLKNIVIPNSVTSIGGWAFCKCSNLESINIPNLLTSIKSATFYECSTLSCITIPANVTDIGESAFYGCTGLTRITIPAGVKNINKNGILQGCINLEEIVVEDGNSIYDSRNNCNAIIETVTNTLISGCKNTIIPDNITKISREAFYNFINLQSITIPSSIVSIGDIAFANCSNVTSIASYVPADKLFAVIESVFQGVKKDSCVLYVPAGTKATYAATEGWNEFTNIVEMEEEKNFCGDSVYWKFDEATGTLTISGSGAMADYEFGSTPWYEESIKRVIIEDGVTSIGQAAFANSYVISSITIPNSVTTIGEAAFAHCYGLTGVTIPNSVTNIKEDAFYSCKGITSIVVNEGNSVYDSRDNCNAIIKTSTNELIQGCKNTIIPNSVTTIGNKAFNFCDGLTNITIPNSVTSIGEYAFSLCDGITSITFPNSVTTIGQAAFAQCEGLTSVTIPNSITTIGFQAFDNCNNIVNITSYIPIDGLFPISVHTFGEVDKGNCTLYVPAGAKATYAATDGWKEFTNIVEMEEEKNFCGDSVYWTFDEATGTLTISGVGTMYYFPYSNYVPWAKHRKNVSNVVIEEGITEIGRYAFWEFCCLKEITIPKGITSIGEYALSHCDSLVHITVEDGNSVYDSRDICNAIIETETNKLVAGCKNTIIPQSVTALASCAFQGCVGLEQITIPKHITQIGNCAFSHCADLAEIKVEDGNTTYDSRNNCNGIIETETNRLIAGCKNTIIPGSVTSIDGAFSGCTELTKIVIPNSITSIGDYSFDYSGLTSVTLPQGIQSIGKWAFDMCSSLTSINSHIPAEKLFAIDVSVFRNVDKDSCTLYVPYGAKATYAATSGWKEFANIVEMLPEAALYVDSLSTAPGRSITLPVGMANSEAVTAFQIDVEVPEGIEFVSATLCDERKTTSHTISTSVLANGKRRIIAYSNNNTPFKLNEGTLLNINLDIPKEAENGDYGVNISNIRLVKPDSKEILLDPISANINVKEMKGDANNDFDVTMGDVVAVANYILELFTGSFNIEAADINGDGEITMGDLVAIINLILYPDDYDYGRNAKRGVMAASGSALSMPDTRSTDEAVSVPVSLSSTMAYTAFQMDIELPEGAKLASATASERAAGHSVAWSCLPDGKMRVVAYSLDNEVFSGNAGELVALNIEAEGAVSGAISVENVRMVTATGDEYAIGNCDSLLDINGTTGIGATDGNGLKVYTAGGALIVESGKAMKVALYSASGKLVKTLEVAEGKNVFEGIPAGTYVVAGVKVAIK